jgi:hypothetical protein
VKQPRYGQKVRILREGYPPIAEIVEVSRMTFTQTRLVVRLRGIEGWFDAELVEPVEVPVAIDGR